MSYFNIDAVKAQTFDAIVVGTGISGGWAAKELTEKGLKTLVLERGRDVKHIVDYPTTNMMPWEFEHRGLPPLAVREASPMASKHYIFREDAMHFVVKDYEHPYVQDKPFSWMRGYQVGGRSLLWARQTNMNVPQSTDPATIPRDLYDRARQAQYRMYTNSRSIINNYGFSFGLNYQLEKRWIFGVNTTFAKLKNAENQDGLEDGFNTPKWMWNGTVSRTNLLERLDATVSYKWQSGYFSQTFLVTGNVPSYSSLDAQLTYRVPMLKSLIKVGASNLLNKYYVSFLGGPSVGGMYYVTVAFNVQ